MLLAIPWRAANAVTPRPERRQRSRSASASAGASEGDSEASTSAGAPGAASELARASIGAVAGRGGRSLGVRSERALEVLGARSVAVEGGAVGAASPARARCSAIGSRASSAPSSSTPRASARAATVFRGRRSVAGSRAVRASRASRSSGETRNGRAFAGSYFAGLTPRALPACSERVKGTLGECSERAPGVPRGSFVCVRLAAPEEEELSRARAELAARWLARNGAPSTRHYNDVMAALRAVDGHPHTGHSRSPVGLCVEGPRESATRPP